jgi:hypothetical protein
LAAVDELHTDVFVVASVRGGALMVNFCALFLNLLCVVGDAKI